MALGALAGGSEHEDDLLRRLFLYRFDRGQGLVGHNFGNLLLTALTDIVGSSTDAIQAAERLLRVHGRVLPVTTDDIHLEAVYDTGEIVRGEHLIDTPPAHLHNARITALSLIPAATINPAAAEALQTAEVIIFSPGDLYTSVLANCIVNGFTAALLASQARIISIGNLMSRPGQTVGMGAAEHIAELTRYIGRRPDDVLINNTPLPPDIVTRYREEGTGPVPNNCSVGTYTIHAKDLLATESIVTQAGDVLTRSLIRHDSIKVAIAIREIIALRPHPRTP